MTALTQVYSCLGDLNVLEIITAPSKVLTESNVFSQSHGDFANYCVHLNRLTMTTMMLPVTEGMLNMGADCATQKMEMHTNHTCGEK